MIADLRSYASCDDGDLLVSQSGTTGTPYRGEQAADRGEQFSYRGERATDRGEQAMDRGEQAPSLPAEIHDAIAKLGTRPRIPQLRAVIVAICTVREWTTPAELARWLDIAPAKLTERHLSPMLKKGLLERRFPDKPTHAEQAYRASQRSLFAPKEEMP